MKGHQFPSLAGAVLILALAPVLGFAQDREDEGSGALFPRAVDHNLYPEMVVRSGLLVRNLGGGWSLGTVPLAFGAQSRVGGPAGSDQDSSALQEGRHATAMGALHGGVLFVHYLNVASQEQTVQRGLGTAGAVPGMPVLAEDSLPR